MDLQAPTPTPLPDKQPEIGKARAVPFTNRLSRWPWWALAIALLGVIVAWGMATDQQYQRIFGAIADGLTITIGATLISYAIAVVMGLIIALGRVAKNPIVYQISTFYVEIIRGVPTLVLLLYIAFVVIPGVVTGLADLGHQMVQDITATIRLIDPILGHVWTVDTFPNRINIGKFIAEPLSRLSLRDVSDLSRVIIALSVAYSAFISEIFRAGIEAVEVGQMEAARALGMTHWQAMRHVVLRQAIRQQLPPLGNDFIAMLKDSSLVSALGVRDITLLGKLYASSTYLTFQTYNVVAFLYLVMTLLLSLVVKGIEQWMARERKR